MDDTEEPQAAVIDIGSGMFKAGFAEYEAPKSVFPSMIGRSPFQVIAKTF